MPFYYCMGTIPDKRHVVFRNEVGKLYQEELVGTKDFSNLSSYHLHPSKKVIILFYKQF